MRHRSTETPIRTPEQATEFLNGFGDLACRIAASTASTGLVDRFLWEYVGDAELYSSEFVLIRRNVFVAGEDHGRVFGRRMINGVTQSGVLVHARQADGGLTGHSNLDYFVATADVFKGDITEWRVNKHRHDLRSGLELTITTDVMDSHDGEASTLAADPLVQRALAAEARYERAQADYRQARLFIGSQGASFKPFAGTPEALGPLRELTDQLSEIRSHLPQIRAVGALGCANLEQMPGAIAAINY